MQTEPPGKMSGVMAQLDKELDKPNWYIGSLVSKNNFGQLNFHSCEIHCSNIFPQNCYIPCNTDG